MGGKSKQYHLYIYIWIFFQKKFPEKPRFAGDSWRGRYLHHTVESNLFLHLDSRYFLILSQIPASGTGNKNMVFGAFRITIGSMYCIFTYLHLVDV